VTPIFPYRKALFADARPVLTPKSPIFRWIRAKASPKADVFPRDTEGHEQTVRAPSLKNPCGLGKLTASGRVVTMG